MVSHDERSETLTQNHVHIQRNINSNENFEEPTNVEVYNCLCMVGLIERASYFITNLLRSTVYPPILS